MLWLVLAVLSTSLSARPELGPPSIKLRTNLSNVVIASLTDIKHDHQLTFKLEQDLHNQAEPIISIRSDAVINRRLKVGEKYVLAYVGWDVTRFPRTIKPRRDGAVIISLNGAAPAIFTPQPELIKLLQRDIEQSLRSPPDLLPLILRGMAEEDRHLQDFFATELVTRPSLYTQLNSAQKQTVAGYLMDHDYAAASRNLMLSNAVFSRHILNDDQHRENIARQILEHYPVVVDPALPAGGLIRTAMKILEDTDDPAYVSEAQRWLASNQPALIESAAAMIYAARPDVLISALQQTLQQTALPEQSRDTLEQLTRRYRRALNS